MLDGWQDQQASRGLNVRTVEVRIAFVRRFAAFVDRYPWEWGPGDLEDFVSRCLSGTRPLAKSTIRNYQTTIRLFCDFITDLRYGWVRECEVHFGLVPQQICHEWNTTAHLSEYEGNPGR